MEVEISGKHQLTTLPLGHDVLLSRDRPTSSHEKSPRTVLTGSALVRAWSHSPILALSVTPAPMIACSIPWQTAKGIALSSSGSTPYSA